MVGFSLLFVTIETSRQSIQHFTPTATDPSGVLVTHHVNGWRDLVVALAILILFFGLLGFSYWVNNRQRSGNQRTAQIKSLTEALTNASGIIESIEADVLEGQRVLAAIQKEIASNKELAELTGEQSELIASVVRRELKKERKPSLVSSSIIALGGITFGALLTHFLEFSSSILSRYKTPGQIPRRLSLEHPLTLRLNSLEKSLVL